MRRAALSAGVCAMFALLSACVGVGIGGDVGIGYSSGYYEPYGYDYGGWGSGYYVGPARGRDYRDRGPGGPRYRPPAYRPPGGGRPMPGMPSHPRSR